MLNYGVLKHYFKNKSNLSNLSINISEIDMERLLLILVIK
jgi:hypothetical protein